ncbi:helix-turn-helix domain-containing protein [Sunxiuqinia indica]|uniref:helix-turn-helix domain-containing protein n=1 Tax=Sunxiuqinia indica TaxID=2692584 RepID=UPI00135B1812|nr:AraC family transcriptional regulator [Sunxiuqinia indica]
MKNLKWKTICPNGSIHLARLYARESEHWQLHSHDFHECSFIIEGSGKQTLTKTDMHLKSGDLIFVSPRDIHGLKANTNSALSIYNVAIEPSIVMSFIDRYKFPLDAWEDKNSEPARIELTETEQKSFLELTSHIEKGYHDQLDAEFFLYGLLRLLRPSRTPLLHDEAPYWLREALQEATNPEYLKSGIKKLVELCGRSQEHMTRTFKKYMGITPTTWLNKHRIAHAKYLLVSTPMSILEIALECGFESPSNFHHLFRKETGESPGLYRKQSTAVQLGFK